MDIEKLLKEMDEYYAAMTDEEFKQNMIEAGFEIVEDGEPGTIIFVDETGCFECKHLYVDSKDVCRCLKKDILVAWNDKSCEFFESVEE